MESLNLRQSAVSRAFSQEAIVEFVRERGGRVRNTDLTEHFKAVFPEEQERKAASRERFKNYVDNVAFVKAENGVKYVCLRRRFRGSFKERRSNGTEAGPEQVFNEGKGARGAQAAEQQTLPGSGYGSDSQVRAPLCGSDGTSTPKSSRKHFIEVMMNTSPQVRRSMVFRRSVHLSSRSDSDSASLVSTNLDDDGTLVTLDPLEHEWMMCASDAEWGSLRRLLNTEPSLVLRKDFVTGFTCLHWAAKHGKPELIALIINFAKQHNVPISVDVRSNTGYTPLHIAAMHNHMEVVKLLVGAYSADLEIRDYSGRKACQYLTDSVSLDIRDIIGAYEQSDSENVDHGDGGRWRFSKASLWGSSNNRSVSQSEKKRL
uniref:Sosondowah ankyrin repeat domain family Cb n=1 Tax=Seriola dumerili TaxID=41447 RepID=A0A3B4V543_SERDU